MNSLKRISGLLGILVALLVSNNARAVDAALPLLEKGWHVVASPCDMAVADIEQAYGTGTIYVFSWIGNNYTPADHFQRGIGYLVKAKTEIDLSTVCGPGSQDSVTVSLAKGWNLIGNPFDSEVGFQDVFGADSDKISGIVSLDERKIMKIPADGVMKVWNGYWVYANTPFTLTINYVALPANLPPAVDGVVLTPATFTQGERAFATITARVSDPEGLGDIAGVGVQESLKGEMFARLYDDGKHGDGAAGDGVYGNSGDFMVPGRLPAGTYTYYVVARDKARNTGYATGTFTVAAATATENLPPAVDGVVLTPATFTQGERAFATITARVSDPEGLGDIVGVGVQESLKGEMFARLYDDGKHGDGAAGDGVYGFSGEIRLPRKIAAGTYTYYVVARDKARNTGYATGTLTVISGPPSP